MASGISIPITSESRGFEQGVRTGVLDPLEDTYKALQKVEGAGDDAGRELETAFERAQRETREFARENRELSDVIRDEARKSSRAIRDIGDDGFNRSSEAVRGFKDEAVQNFSEVASSFDGSIEGAVDGVQGTLGGLATAISGPLGLALGGLGIVAGTVASQWATAAEETKENWREMYEDMVESGADFLSQDLINQKIQDIAGDTERFKGVLSDATTAGATWSEVLRAQAGDMTALREVLSSARGELEQQEQAQEDFIAKNGDESAAIADKVGALELLITKYDRMITAQDGAAKAADTARRAMDESAGANNRTADSLDRVASSAGGIPSNKSVVVTADTRAFDAEMERIRRTRYQATGELTWQHRGRQLP